MSGSAYLGQSARLRLLELGGRSPSYQDVAEDEAENLRKRLLSGPTVDIFVGPERKQWSLHRRLLCYHSTYFKTEFEGHEVPRKNTPKDNKLDLPDDDPVGFELLTKWIYQGQLEDTSGMSDEAKYDYAVACHKLYLLCDKFDMIRLKNIAMDQYRTCLHESQLVPDAEEINEIYRASPIDSAFRSLMVNIAARQFMDPDVERDAESYRKCFENNPSFAVEMINAVRHMSGGILFDDPTEGDFCAYHDHNDVSGCRIEGKGKGKARSQQAKAGAVNGQGLGTRKQQYITIPPLVELSAERRTPRKLNTPSKSSVRKAERRTSDGVSSTPSANQRVPRQPLAETNGDEQPGHVSRSKPRKLESRKVPSATEDRNSSEMIQTSSQTSPFDASSQTSPNRSLRLSSLTNKDITPNPTEASPLVIRSSDSKRKQTAVNRTAPPPKIKLQNGETNRPRIEDDSRSISTISTMGDSESVTSVPSRKRKFAEQRTPQHTSTIDENTVRPTLSKTPSGGGRSTGSIASGPKKLSRVSSIARQFDSTNGNVNIIDGKEEVRRAPPKLRLGSGPMGMR